MSRSQDNRRRRTRAARKMRRWHERRIVAALDRMLGMEGRVIAGRTTIRSRGATLYVDTVL